MRNKIIGKLLLISIFLDINANNIRPRTEATVRKIKSLRVKPIIHPEIIAVGYTSLDLLHKATKIRGRRNEAKNIRYLNVLIALWSSESQKVTCSSCP